MVVPLLPPLPFPPHSVRSLVLLFPSCFPLDLLFIPFPPFRLLPRTWYLRIGFLSVLFIILLPFGCCRLSLLFLTFLCCYLGYIPWVYTLFSYFAFYLICYGFFSNFFCFLEGADMRRRRNDGLDTFLHRSVESSARAPQLRGGHDAAGHG